MKLIIVNIKSPNEDSSNRILSPEKGAIISLMLSPL